MSDGARVQESGLGTILTGVKIRFLDEESSGVAMSTYPQVQFHQLFSSSDPELTDPGNQYILPLEISKTLGAWQLDADAGYLYGTSVSNELFYGLLAGYEKLKPWEPLVEAHVNAHLDGTGSALLLNFGFRRSVAEGVSLIAALGRTLLHVRDGDDEVDVYLGAQIEL